MRSLLLVTTLLFSAWSFAQDGTYSVSETPLGTLLDNPAAVAVLDAHMPGFSSNPNLDMVREITLVDVQAYSPDPLTADELAEIDAELAELPAN